MGCTCAIHVTSGGRQLVRFSAPTALMQEQAVTLRATSVADTAGVLGPQFFADGLGHTQTPQGLIIQHPGRGATCAAMPLPGEKVAKR